MEKPKIRHQHCSQETPRRSLILSAGLRYGDHPSESQQRSMFRDRRLHHGSRAAAQTQRFECRRLNHFGFRSMTWKNHAANCGRGPRDTRNSTRGSSYAEQRACDPEGNMFDLSLHGFERVETGAERDEKVTVAH